jgi:amino-acid N-acetyltransferase
MSDIAICAARPADLAEVIDLLTICDLPHEDLTAQHLALFRIVRRGPALVAVAGFERFGVNGLLRSLAVAPVYRGQGLGGKLVSAVESSAVENGLSDLYLLTLTAEAFFAQRGYLRVERARVPETIQATAEFTRLCPATAVCMWKPLR